eukprot:m.1212367 g.1212367  ORF g.1212367 m.1212367 type:complete len:61 (-) comp24597_c0_seq46:2566-2748(-)
MYVTAVVLVLVQLFQCAVLDGHLFEERAYAFVRCCLERRLSEIRCVRVTPTSTNTCERYT